MKTYAKAGLKIINETFSFVINFHLQLISITIFTLCLLMQIFDVCSDNLLNMILPIPLSRLATPINRSH